MAGRANKQKRELDEMARHMLREAVSKDSDRVFSATGFARTDISIAHQQVRCFNLVWALLREKKVRTGDVVAVIGGGFSGLLIATALAMQKRCIVYVIEKEPRLLDLFRRSSHRFLSPNLNSRDLPPRFNLERTSPLLNPPIFGWRGGDASEVAHFWLHEFRRLTANLPVFTFVETRVTKVDEHGEGVRVHLDRLVEPAFFDVAIAINATGFGQESKLPEVDDYSYWKSGHELIYTSRGRQKNTVMISGCGDSGVVELMHYVFKDFDHRNIESYYLQGVESHIQPALEQSIAWQVLFSEEVEMFDHKVISELCWYAVTCWHKTRNPQLRILAGSGYEGVFRAIGDELVKAGLKAKLSGDESTYGDELMSLSRVAQYQIRRRVRPLIDEAASNEIAAIMEALDIKDLDRERSLIRPGFEIHLNATTPTPYSTVISPANLWFLRLAIHLGNVNYVRGKIREVKSSESGFKVFFGNGRMFSYDHVCTRYGPPVTSTAAIEGVRRRHRSDHHGDWLLAYPFVRMPNDNSGFYCPRNPAISTIARKIEARKKAARRGDPVDKGLYMISLMGGGRDIERERDPQGWLAEQLRNGKRVRFVEGFFRNPL